MKYFVAATILASFAPQVAVAIPAQHFTITAFGDRAPSGALPRPWGTRFLIHTGLSDAPPVKCKWNWFTQDSYPTSYVPCNDTSWSWAYQGVYGTCNFALSIAHVTQTSDSANNYNVTSFAKVNPNQTPCGQSASDPASWFVCANGTAGYTGCGLTNGAVMQLPVISQTTATLTSAAPTSTAASIATDASSAVTTDAANSISNTLSTIASPATDAVAAATSSASSFIAPPVIGTVANQPAANAPVVNLPVRIGTTDVTKDSTNNTATVPQVRILSWVKNLVGV